MTTTEVKQVSITSATNRKAVYQYNVYEYSFIDGWTLVRIYKSMNAAQRKLIDIESHGGQADITVQEV